MTGFIEVDAIKVSYNDETFFLASFEAKELLETPNG